MLWCRSRSVLYGVINTTAGETGLDPQSNMATSSADISPCTRPISTKNEEDDNAVTSSGIPSSELDGSGKKKRRRRRGAGETGCAPMEPAMAILPPCAVCGAKSSGHHFGAVTCEACKVFFLRKMESADKLKCHKEEKCPIYAVASARRFTCTYCRLQKCFSVGMCREGIKKGRYRLEKRTHLIQEAKLKQQELDAKALKEQSEEPVVCMGSSMSPQTRLANLSPNRITSQSHHAQHPQTGTPSMPQHTTLTTCAPPPGVTAVTHANHQSRLAQFNASSTFYTEATQATFNIRSNVVYASPGTFLPVNTTSREMIGEQNIPSSSTVVGGSTTVSHLVSQFEAVGTGCTTVQPRDKKLHQLSKESFPNVPVSQPMDIEVIEIKEESLSPAETPEPRLDGPQDEYIQFLEELHHSYVMDVHDLAKNINGARQQQELQNDDDILTKAIMGQLGPPGGGCHPPDGANYQPPVMDAESKELLTKLLEVINYSAHMLVKYAKHLDDFKELCVDDQIKLLKANSVLWTLLSWLPCINHKDVNKTLNFGSGMCLSIHGLMKMSGTEFLDSWIKCTSGLINLQLHPAELGVLKALVLFATDTVEGDLVNQRLVDQKHDKYAEMLQNLTHLTRPKQPFFLGKIVESLTAFRSHNDLQNKVTDDIVHNRFPDIEVPQLVHEMTLDSISLKDGTTSYTVK